MSRNIKRKVIIIRCIVAFLVLCSTKMFSQERSGNIVLIFSDVTSSLKVHERDNVAIMTANVLDAVPQKSEYYVFPIQQQTERMPPMYYGKVPLLRNASDRRRYDRVKFKRRKEIDTIITEMYNKVNHPLAIDNRSCIINSLQFAARFLAPYRVKQTKKDYHLVIISDMIEECDRTILEQVKLNKQMINNEIERAKSIGILDDLSFCKITIIIPSSLDSLIVSKNRPDQEVLKEFWETIFFKHHFTNEQLDDPSKFIWSTSGVTPALLFK